MGKFKATQQKHLRHIAVAELVTRPVEQRLKHDVGRHFDEVKRGAGTFVEGATTALAVKDSIAQIGRALQLGGLSRVAMRTVHETRAADLAQRGARIPSGERTYNSEEPVLTVSHELYRALKAFGRIIKSLFTLRYIR